MSEILLPRLQVPVPPAVYRRPRLEARLTEALARRVLAVRAGPGYGKTTLLADFANRSGLPVVWLQVDERDGDPGHLARYLLEGLDRLAAGEASGRVAPGEDGQAGIPPRAGDVSSEGLLARLLDALVRAASAQARGPLVIVLNDLDVVGEAPETAGLLSSLVEYLPGGTGLWLTCRTMPALPLPRWKARRLATELGEEDLALSPEEIRDFCREILNLELDEAAARLVHRATFGWVTGLVLFVESLPSPRAASRPTRREADLVRAARHLLQVLGARPGGAPSGEPGPSDARGALAALYQYLASEILQRLRPELQRFLMQSAVLPFLSVDGCAFLSKAVGSAAGEKPVRPGEAGPGHTEPWEDAAALLEEAVERVPMVFPLGEGRYTYHPMLRVFLVDKLREVAGNRRFQMLQRRAGDYLASRGWREEALDCYVQGRAWSRVARVLREHGRTFVRSGSLHALESWLAPLPPEVLGREPELLNVLAAVRSAQGKGDAALALWEKAVRLSEEALAGTGQATVGVEVAPGGSGEAAAGSTGAAWRPKYPRARLPSLLVDCRTQMADVFTDRGQAERARDTLAPLIEQTDDEVPADARARVYHSLARATWMSLDWNRTRVLVEQAMEHYGRAGDHRGQAAMLNVLGATVHEPRGDLERALSAYRRALELVEGELASPQMLLYRVNRDHILAELGLTAEATAGLEETVSLARQWGLDKVLTLATLFLGEAYLDAGRVADALATLERALEMAAESGDKLRVAGAQYGLANVHRARGEPDRALEAAQEDLRLVREIGNPYFLAQSLTNLAFLHLDRGEAAAIAYLEEAECSLAQHPNAWEQVRVHLGLALAHREDDPSRSRHHLQRCLEMCEGRNYTMIFRRERDLCAPLLADAYRDGVCPATVSRILAELGVGIPELGSREPEAHEAAAGGGFGPVPTRATPAALPVLGAGAGEAPCLAGVAVQCLGSLRVWVNGEEVARSAWGKAKALRLFKYLLAHRRRWVALEDVLDALWPEMEADAAAANFRVLLHHARRALSGTAPPAARRACTVAATPLSPGERGSAAGRAAEPAAVLLYASGRCRVDWRALAWVDADEFARCVEQGRGLAREGRAEDATAHFARAVDLYRGDFLGEEPHEEWAEAEREMLRGLALEALEWLSRHAAGGGDHGRAVALLRRALALDPYREDLHRLLMIELVESGRRAEALQQYRRCEEILARELDAAPAPETTELYRHLLRGAARPAALA
ncbi:MAG: BTAD domain-containing putative transcriptional regulator [Bacillota bacterium]|nr:BTAD domain-containing putative transcriptional regulator [Bacillota bacterium]